MNSTAKKLQSAITNCEKASRLYMNARQAMREAIKEHLVGTDTGALAKKLESTAPYVSNLKYGYSVPSIDMAKKVLQVTQ